MDNTALVNSLGIGGAIFAGLVLVWFLRTYFKRRITPNQSNSIKTSWEEKRRHPRVAVSWTAQMETSQGNLSAQLKDISLGGAFVVCPNPLPLTEQFRLTVSAPSREPFTLNAEVVWSNSNVPEDKVINRGMGVRFIQNTDEDRKRLHLVIASHVEEAIENSNTNLSCES